MNETILRLVITALIGEPKKGSPINYENYLFVGSLGRVNKMFLKTTRERHIWEYFYYATFPRITIPLGSKHLGKCTYNRCRIGEIRTPDRNVPLSDKGYMIKVYQNRFTDTRIRCMNPDHYQKTKIRSIKSNFIDMFVCSAKRYYIINKGKFNWTPKDEKFLNELKIKSEHVLLDKIYELYIKLMYKRIRNLKFYNRFIKYKSIPNDNF